MTDYESNELSKFVQGKDLEYVVNFVTAANSGYSRSFVGIEVVVNLILAIRDTNQRLSELEEKK